MLVMNRTPKFSLFLWGVFLGAVFLFSVVASEQDYAPEFEVWGVFHYYLGAKYFDEVGYAHLYTCALTADEESTNALSDVHLVRDMANYAVVPRDSLPPCPREQFTAERWKDFSNDVGALSSRASPAYYQELFTDKGFNPTPFWAVVAKRVANLVSLQNPVETAIVFNLDIAAFVFAGFFVWMLYGNMAALLFATLVVFYFGNPGRIGGNFLQYAWFLLLVASIYFWEKGKPSQSGALLGLSTGLQIFPLLFAVPMLFLALRTVVFGNEEGRASPWRFSAWFFGVCIATLLIGSISAWGVGGWMDWEKKISLHKYYLQGEIFNIGLANFVSTAVSPSRPTVKHYAEDVPHTAMQLEALRSHRLTYYFLAGLLLLGWLFLLLYRRTFPVFGLGYIMLYALFSLSPYYWVILTLMLFVFWNSPQPLRAFALYGTAALFLTHVPLLLKGYVTFAYGDHVASELLIFTFVTGLVIAGIATSEQKVSEQKAFSD